MRFVALTYRKGATLEVVFGGQNAQRPTEMVDVDEFIGVKSHRAKGKRITTYDVASLRFIEPETPEEDDYEVEPADEDIEGMEESAQESIDMSDIVGEEIKADPTVDYTTRTEGDDAGFSASQLDLFS